jgi:DNA-binding MurR/RpiR family transcriptional regulator
MYGAERDSLAATIVLLKVQLKIMATPSQLAQLQDQIRSSYDSLSKRLKQVARYILDNGNTIPFETIASIAEKADVPPSTLIRFANNYGFDGFNEMKQVFRQHLDAGAPETPAEILKVFSMVNEQALQQLSSQIKAEDLERAVKLLDEAENIYVIGFRRSFSIAAYLTYAFRHLERRTFLIDGLGGMFNEQLNMVRPTDVVISISNSPYAQEVVDLVSMGAAQGAKQIAITDSLVSPLTAFSEVCFIVREAQVDGFRSQIASMCLAQTLMMSLALKGAGNIAGSATKK